LDFVPSDTQLFFDDLSTLIGIFFQHTGIQMSVTATEGYPNKWLNITVGYNTAYIPDVTNRLKKF
jgi:hypothetical protein